MATTTPDSANRSDDSEDSFTKNLLKSPASASPSKPKPSKQFALDLTKLLIPDFSQTLGKAKKHITHFNNFACAFGNELSTEPASSAAAAITFLKSGRTRRLPDYWDDLNKSMGIAFPYYRHILTCLYLRGHYVFDKTMDELLLSIMSKYEKI